MRWFLPVDYARPAHLPPLSMTGEVSVVAGPDGGPGRIIGGTYEPDEPGWQQVGTYWINATGSTPRRLLRLDARDGIEVPGIDDHRWLIPVLLRPAAGGLVWAGESRLGPDGWSVPPPPEPYRSLGLRIREPMISGGWDALGDDGVTDLALAAYCANYHMVPAELRMIAWVSSEMLAPGLQAIIGMEA